MNYTYLYSTLIQSPRLDIHNIVHPNVWQWAVWVFQKPPDCQNREGLAAYSWAWTLYTVELPPIVWPYIKKDILHAWKLERIIDQLLPSKTNCFLRKLRSSTCSSMLARQINQLLPPANSDAPYLLPPSLPYLRPPVHSYPPPLVVPFHLNSYNLARKPCSRHPTQSVTSPKEKAKVLDPQLHFHLHKT